METWESKRAVYKDLVDGSRKNESIFFGLLETRKFRNEFSLQGLVWCPPSQVLGTHSLIAGHSIFHSFTTLHPSIR
jgi:hypothetical protein